MFLITIINILKGHYPELDDITKPVALYGALIATVALLWNIISAVRKSRARLRVRANFGLQFVGDQFANPLSRQKPTVKITITNTGPTTRHIKRPFFKVSRRIGGENEFEKITPMENFPVRIEPGQTYEMTLDLESLSRDVFEKLRDKDSMLFVVTDTLGKRFISKPLKIHSIKKYIAAFR